MGRSSRRRVGWALALLVLGAWSLFAAGSPTLGGPTLDVVIDGVADVADAVDRGWDVAQPAAFELEGLAEERDPEEEEEEGPGPLARASGFVRLGSGCLLAVLALPSVRPARVSGRPTVRGPPVG